MRSHTYVWSALAFFIIFFVCMCGCTETGEPVELVNTNVSIEDAWVQAAVDVLGTEMVFEFENEQSGDFNNSVVLKKPAVIICDPDGNPLHYLFFVGKNGETVSTIRVSANKSLGRTITGIGDLVYYCGNETLNLSAGPAGSKTEYFVCGTPVPEYSNSYGEMMVDAWEVWNQYSKNVLKDLKDAGIDISESIPVDERETVREIIYNNIWKREESIEEFENKYQVDWAF